MNTVRPNHLEQSVQKMYSQQNRIQTYMDQCDPQDISSWEAIYKMNLDVAGATFAAQQEFKLEHFLAKNLISSI
ncbi:MAG: hypothetical protein JWQ11_4909 [Rhizobacter sp.]|nr:hypothetical protein [Rhizobacter sp.]